jgi:hypothetical protein
LKTVQIEIPHRCVLVGLTSQQKGSPYGWSVVPARLDMMEASIRYSIDVGQLHAGNQFGDRPTHPQ